MGKTKKTSREGSTMNDVFGGRAAAFPRRELVFEWRPPQQHYRNSTAQLATVWIMAGLILVAFVFIFRQPLSDVWRNFMSYPYDAAKWQALSWHDLGSFWAKLDAWKLAPALLYSVVWGFSLWFQRRLHRSRVYLSNSTLSQRSGLPLWLGNLLGQNWTLSLDDFRSGRLAFTLHGQGPFPSIALYFLRWKGAHSTTAELMRQPRLAPASWFLIGQPARERLQKPEGLSWQLNPWNTPEGKAVRQGAFDQLPLVAGLRAQGVPLPPLSRVRPAGLGENGFDLMAYPRMKAVVLGFFGLLASAGLAYHFMRHQHYFQNPPLWTWVALGGCCALAAWGWMVAERQAPGEPSLKPTQCVLALLPGVAAALLAPSALLALNQVLIPAQSVTVTVRHSPLQLQPDDASIPAFSPQEALAFWASLPAGTRRQITVRQGLLGTWQYDSTPLQQEVQAFYGRR